LIPGYWYAGRPIGFGVSHLISAIWKYVVAALLAGGLTAGIIRGTSLWESPLSTSAALAATVIVSMLFLTLYLIMIILFYRGFAPLHQLGSLLGELAPSRKAQISVVEAVGKYE
jgi:hypothetical protein